MAQVFFNCGGFLDPNLMETVLCVMFTKMSEVERRTGHAVSSLARVRRPKMVTRKTYAKKVCLTEVESEQERDDIEAVDHRNRAVARRRRACSGHCVRLERLR